MLASGFAAIFSENMDVIPSFYTQEMIGRAELNGLLPSSNVQLRFGEVKKEILPSNSKSHSKRYREYEVLVEHFEGGSATHRMYHNCMVLNNLGGLGDRSNCSLRESDKKDFQLGTGSKVFLLCVEGNDARAVIIGGPQQYTDISKGAHYEFEFNGVNFQINNDGSWTLQNKGKTDAKGNLDKAADKDGAGTVVKVEANGNFSVTTKDNKNTVSINHKSGEIIIDASDNVKINTKNTQIVSDSTEIKSDSVNVNSHNVKVGANAMQPAVLGQALVTVLTQAFGVIAPTLPTPPQQAALAGASAQLMTILSQSVKIGA
jgi:hypothetical protein